ncbi:MAG: DUF4286 family protein [Bacteroidota bacterium]|nr:DUF4286 family protein [Bacteroidota bacterium]
MGYVYAVTVQIQLSHHDEWLAYMKGRHIQDVLDTGCFSKASMTKVLKEDEREGLTYTIHYHFNDFSSFTTYEEMHAPKLQEEHQKLFDGKFLAFRSIHRVITL